MLKITKRMKAKLEKPHWVRFWGQRTKCRPFFCENVCGNGDQLVAIIPLDTRPNYYLIRVDSSWSLSNYDEPCIADNLDEIYDALEDCFGPRYYEDNDGNNAEEGWPAFDFGSGQAWDDAMDLLKAGQAERRQ